MAAERRGVKRCAVDEFLDEEKRKIAKSKSATRLELARAINRKDQTYQKMLKAKERARKAMEKFRESECAYEAACEEEVRLKRQLEEDAMEEGYDFYD